MYHKFCTFVYWVIMSSAYFLQFFQFFLEGSYFISFFWSFGVFHTIIRLDSVYLVVSFPLEVSFVVLSSAFLLDFSSVCFQFIWLFFSILFWGIFPFFHCFMINFNRSVSLLLVRMLDWSYRHTPHTQLVWSSFPFWIHERRHTSLTTGYWFRILG